MTLTKASYQLINGAPINVLDYGADNTGVADSTTALQNAVAACISSGVPVFMPAGTYLITDTITCTSKVQIIGEHYSMAATNNGTKINFAPTTAKDLFVLGSSAGFTDAYSFQNLFIVGNSANSTGNSNRAFNLTKAIKSTFKNMRVDSFRTAFKIEGSINNRFEFIQAANHYVSVISYEGTYSTTDVWEQCYISNAPIGVQTSGINLGIRFTNTLFETLETYGVNLVKETYGWSFINCYSEDVPSVNTSTNAMFKIGYDGTATSGEIQAIISAGYYGGRNAGAVGSFVDVDTIDGVQIANPIITRFTNGVKTTSNTPTKSVLLGGWTCSTVSNVITDATKIAGYYPDGVFNSGTHNGQNAIFVNVTSGKFTNGTVTWTSGTTSPEGNVTAPVGSIYSNTNGGAGTSFYVKESGSGNTGWVGK